MKPSQESTLTQVAVQPMLTDQASASSDSCNQSCQRRRRWKPNHKQQELMEQVYKVASNYQIKDIVAVCIPRLRDQGSAPEIKVFNWFNNRIAKDKRLSKHKEEKRKLENADRKQQLMVDLQIEENEEEEEEEEENEILEEIGKKEQAEQTWVKVDAKDQEIQVKEVFETNEKTGVEIYLDESGLICVRYK